MESIQFLHKGLGSKMVIRMQQCIYLNVHGYAIDSQISRSRRSNMTDFTDLLCTGLTNSSYWTIVIILDSGGYSKIARSVFILN